MPWYSSVTEREYYVDYSEPLLLVNGILTLFHVFDLLLIVCRYDSTMQLVVWWCGGVVVWWVCGGCVASGVQCVYAAHCMQVLYGSG